MRRHILRCVRPAAVALAGLLMTGCALAGALPARSHAYVVPVGAQMRSYILHVPRGLGPDDHPALVVMLHGHGARAESFERSTGMSQKADREKFIVVYPQALGSPSVWHSAVDGSIRIDDVAFIRTLIDSLVARHHVDPRRVYVAGHSNGAFMAYRIGSALSSRVAAVGVSAGSIGRITRRGDTLRIRTPAEPVAVIAFHGKADRSVPYDGGPEVDGPRHIVPTPESIHFWVTGNGCNPVAASDTVDGGNVIRDDYTGCQNGSEVVLYTIVDGTHRWPGDHTPWWKFSGNTGHSSVDATDLMWAFFEAHARRPLATDSVRDTSSSNTPSGVTSRRAR